MSGVRSAWSDGTSAVGAGIPPGLGLGCWEFSDIGTGAPDDDNSVRIIRAAVDAGVIHLDTAQDYGKGHSERVVGRAIDRVSRAVFVATKTHATGRSETIAAVEESLERLGTDHIDLFYIHWPRTGLDLRPMMEALEELRARGKIRLIGVSNFGVAEMEQVREVGRIDAHQICYSLLWRYPEREIIPYCIRHDIAVVTYSTIAQGLLSDTKRGPDSFANGDARRTTIYYREDVWPRIEPLVDEMRRVAQKRAIPLAALAIRWVLAHRTVRSALVAARTLAQLERNVEAASGRLDAATEEELTALSDEAMRRIPDVGNIFLFYP